MNQKNGVHNGGEIRMEKTIMLKIAEILFREHLLTAEEQLLFTQMLQKA